MVKTPSTAVIKLRGETEVYHIEVDPETTSKALTSIEDLNEFEIEYVCPNCLSKNTSVFTSFPEDVSVFCSSCRKSHIIYDVSNEELVLMNEKLGELLRGVRELCSKSQLREIIHKGDLSLWDCIFINSISAVFTRLRLLISIIGILVALSGLFIPKFDLYFYTLGLLIITSCVINSDVIRSGQLYVRTRLVKWIQYNSGYSTSSKLLDKRYSSGIIRWRLSQ